MQNLVYGQCGHIAEMLGGGGRGHVHLLTLVPTPWFMRHTTDDSTLLVLDISHLTVHSV